MDLGADGWQTFRYVTFPAIRTAVVAGALLAFALSFDEIVVTNFTSGTEITIPKFIYNNLRQPRNRPIVNVVAVVVVLVMLIPIYFAQRLAGGGGPGRPAGQRATLGRTPKRGQRYWPGVRLAVSTGVRRRAAGPAPASPRRRSSSNCARADACWANIAAWIPWNSPSSQPTSWACATRISDSVGHPLERRRELRELLLQVLREHASQLGDARS